VRGSLTSAEPVTIEGGLHGTLQVQGPLCVEQHAEVQADVVALDIVVHGMLEGTLDAERAVFIGRSARVNAEVRAAKVVIEDGAFFTGRIEMDVPLPEDV
jgi:cytoskeletal protein CcmA (bactofilin family)